MNEDEKKLKWWAERMEFLVNGIIRGWLIDRTSRRSDPQAEYKEPPPGGMKKFKFSYGGDEIRVQFNRDPQWGSLDVGCSDKHGFWYSVITPYGRVEDLRLLDFEGFGVRDEGDCEQITVKDIGRKGYFLSIP